MDNEEITIGYENVSWTEEKLQNRLNDYFYIAEVDGKVIGYSFGEIREGNAQPVINRDEKYLEIFELFIHSDYRSQGIGKKLVEHLITASERNNINRILVGSSNRNWKDTAKFYEELGLKMWYFQMYR